MKLGFDTPPCSVTATANVVRSLAVARHDAIISMLAETVPSATAIDCLEGSDRSLQQVLDLALHPAVGNAYAALLSRRKECSADAVVILRDVSVGAWPVRGIVVDDTLNVWDNALFAALPHLGLQEKPCEVDVAAASVEAALMFLRDCWPEAYAWLKLVVRNVIVVEGQDDRLVSGSIDQFLGTLYLSRNSNALRTAEMLVHEGSHQFFLLLENAEPVVDGLEPEVYSPFVRRVRPLSRVMLGFHAFCNVATLYEKAGEAGPGVPQENDQELQSLFMFEGLRAVFRREWPLITPSGRALIEHWMDNG